MTSEMNSTEALDPICGMSVNTADAKHVFDYRGTTYYFCCAGCKSKFSADPQKYMQPMHKDQSPPTPTSRGAEAIDPICGMSVNTADAKHTFDYQGATYYFCCAGCKSKFSAAPEQYLPARMNGESQNRAQDSGAEATDPVCGMSVQVAKATHRFDYQGSRYYFCAPGCKTRFSADPEHYLQGRHRIVDKSDTRFYICPMDPEVRQVGPGTCPKCGMALEPEEISLEETGPNPELLDFLRRLKFGAPLAGLLFLLEMGGHLGVQWPVFLGPQAML
jgi:Cu+-exporting ATPase